MSAVAWWEIGVSNLVAAGDNHWPLYHGVRLWGEEVEATADTSSLTHSDHGEGGDALTSHG